MLYIVMTDKQGWGRGISLVEALFNALLATEGMAPEKCVIHYWDSIGDAPEDRFYVDDMGGVTHPKGMAPAISPILIIDKKAVKAFDQISATAENLDMMMTVNATKAS